MIKPYTSKLSASGCVPGTVLWLPATQLRTQDDGCMEPVVSYRQWWGANGYRGTWINGRLYVGRSFLEVVVGAGTKR